MYPISSFSRLLSLSSVAAFAFLATATLVESAHAEPMILKTPGVQPKYSVELEPHMLIGLFPIPGIDSGTGLGLGGRATLPILPDGFLPKLNDSIGIGFGLDWVRYSGGSDRASCSRYESTPSGTPVCVETEGGGKAQNALVLPVVMQWNFFLTQQFSVFGEPGIALSHRDNHDLEVMPFVIWAGGRYHFSDKATLTLRIGYPTVSFGVSFLL